MATVIAIRHVHFEDLGLLELLLTRRGHEVAYLDAWSGDLKAAASANLLVILGGPIAAYDEDDYPFLATERKIVAQRLERQAPVLGICLGAQIMARALGAEVAAGSAPEIGYRPVELTAAGLRSPLRHLAGVSVLHWHGDICQLPAGATCLGRTEICPVQAFAVEDYALALQFHAEVPRSGIEPWLIGHCLEISTRSGSSVGQLRSATRDIGGRLADAGEALFSEWLAGLGL